jgi:hypothetical protein
LADGAGCADGAAGVAGAPGRVCLGELLRLQLLQLFRCLELLRDSCSRAKLVRRPSISPRG